VLIFLRPSFCSDEGDMLVDKEGVEEESGGSHSMENACRLLTNIHPIATGIKPSGREGTREGTFAPKVGN
jgi:hypothetical protein